MNDIVIHPDGMIQFIHDDDLTALFPAEQKTVRRASHVEPTASGEWTADLSPVGGPVLGPFTRRADALRAEVEWLDARMARGPVKFES